eukprot:scaffold6553_cov126-Isochrysis_galbana.AAC.3
MSGVHTWPRGRFFDVRPALAAAPRPRELTHDRPPPPPTPHRPPKRVGAWSAVVEHAVLPPTCGCNHPYSGEAMSHLQLEGWGAKSNVVARTSGFYKKNSRSTARLRLGLGAALVASHPAQVGRPYTLLARGPCGLYCRLGSPLFWPMHDLACNAPTGARPARRGDARLEPGQDGMPSACRAAAPLPVPISTSPCCPSPLADLRAGAHRERRRSMAGTLTLVPGCVSVSADSAGIVAVVPGAEVVGQAASVVNGILQPPADLRGAEPPCVASLAVPRPPVSEIINKTAQFVARNGPEFESRILKNEQANLKFAFLNPKDPFHPFYRSRVSELGGKAPEEAPASAGVSKPTTAKIAPRAAPLEPPRPMYMVPRPVGVLPLDVDIIQLSAQ